LANTADRNRFRTKNRVKNDFAGGLEKYRQEFAGDLGLDPKKIKKPVVQTETNIKPSK